MTKTLYITDLDGTLLNNEAEVSDYTVTVLNRLIDAGMHFSVATARTAASAKIILKDVRFTVPVVLMSGVLIHDPIQNRYIKVEGLQPDTVGQIVRILKRHGVTGFMYGLNGETQMTYYETLDPQPLRQFYEERIAKYYKTFTQVASFSDVGGDVIYLTLRDEKARLMPVFDALREVCGIEVMLYHDNYDEKLWYVECFSDKASKYNAVRYLRETYGYERIVCFGDNLNDLPMFRACDERYAVANAKAEVKAAATAVLDRSNDGDGVARWLLENVLVAHRQKSCDSL